MSGIFTKQELDLMFDAIEAWECEDRGPGMMPHLLQGMLSQSDSAGASEAAAKLQQEIEQRKRQADADRRQRKARGCLLRAKLIGLRDQIDVEEFLDSTLKTSQNAIDKARSAQGLDLD